jgi:secondary thiamine-phosphate synthase enzyme
LVKQKSISFATTELKITNITSQIEDFLENSGMQNGIIHIFNVGSTAAITHIEYEPGLQKDFPELMETLIPAQKSYQHDRTWNDDNGHSHLRATLLGPELTAPFTKQQLSCGTWQQIVHIEFDHKPRQRQVILTILGE